MTRGTFLVFEGPDGSGKTTQARRIAEQRDALFTREPGGTAIGERIRDLLLDPANSEMDDRTEALLYAAGRAQHVVEVIEPALAAGRDVVCDRFISSSLAYQGVGRGLGVDAVRGLSLFATGGLLPDAIVLIDVPSDVSLDRLAGEHDRLESGGESLLNKVNSAYAQFAAADPATWVVVDGVGSIEQVAGRLDSALSERLNW